MGRLGRGIASAAKRKWNSTLRHFYIPKVDAALSVQMRKICGSMLNPYEGERNSGMIPNTIPV
jgi:hypothetical protein